MRAILFDKDGTILDFAASWSGVYRDLALTLAEGDPNRARLMLLQGGFDTETGHIAAGSVLSAGNTLDITRLWFADLGEAEFAAMVARIDAMFHENGIRYSVPIEGLAETLDALAAMDLVMGIATSDGTAAAKAAVAKLGFAHHLPHIYGYDSVPDPKPGPGMVHAFADATGIPLADIAVVGDSLHDLEMAKRAGAGAAIGVASGTSSAELLAPHADVVLPSIRELPAWLHQNRK